VIGVTADAAIRDESTRAPPSSAASRSRECPSLKVATGAMMWSKKPADRSLPEHPRARVEVLLAGEQGQGQHHDLGEEHLSEVLSEILAEVVTQTISTTIS